MKHIQLTSDEWIEQYDPIFDEDGTLVDYDPRIDEGFGLPSLKRQDLETAIAENRAWTMLDTDGHLYIVSGTHTVNMLSYHITEKPYNEDEDIEVDYESDFDDQ